MDNFFDILFAQPSGGASVVPGRPPVAPVDEREEETALLNQVQLWAQGSGSDRELAAELGPFLRSRRRYNAILRLQAPKDQGHVYALGPVLRRYAPISVLMHLRNLGGRTQEHTYLLKLRDRQENEPLLCSVSSVPGVLMTELVMSDRLAGLVLATISAWLKSRAGSCGSAECCPSDIPSTDTRGIFPGPLRIQ